jgi:hypothetical protein
MNSAAFSPMAYDIFAGLDVDKRSIAVTFTNPQGFIRSVGMPYKVDHVVNDVRNHFIRKSPLPMRLDRQAMDCWWPKLIGA